MEISFVRDRCMRNKMWWWYYRWDEMKWDENSKNLALYLCCHPTLPPASWLGSFGKLIKINWGKVVRDKKRERERERERDTQQQHKQYKPTNIQLLIWRQHLLLNITPFWLQRQRRQRQRRHQMAELLTKLLTCVAARTRPRDLFEMMAERKQQRHHHHHHLCYVSTLLGKFIYYMYFW